MSKSLEGVLVKPAHTKEEYTDEQILEFAKCAHPDSGPLYFLSNYFNIQHPKKGQLIYDPFDFQKELIETYHNYRFSINLLSRQTGKCLLYSTRINCINKNIRKQQQIGDLLWNEMTIKQKIITKLENWLVALAKSEDAS